jgi:hypothetical protein
MAGASTGYFTEGGGPKRPPVKSHKVTAAEPEADPFDTAPKSSSIDSASHIEKRCNEKYNRGGTLTGSSPKTTDSPHSTP